MFLSQTMEVIKLEKLQETRRAEVDLQPPGKQLLYDFQSTGDALNKYTQLAISLYIIKIFSTVAVTKWTELLDHNVYCIKAPNERFFGYPNGPLVDSWGGVISGCCLLCRTLTLFMGGALTDGQCNHNQLHNF